MPRLTKSLPKYRKHKASCQAVVTIAGRDIYLGPHGTKTSKVEYDRVIAEWLAAGRPSYSVVLLGEITIAEVMAAYMRHVKKRYVKNGESTSEQHGIRSALRPLKHLYSKQLVVEFGPMSLKAVRQKMIDTGMSRGTINQNVGRIKRMFRWAASEELIPADVCQSLSTVTGLRKDESQARETSPILPVDDETVEQTLPHLPEIVADMVRLQRLTGMRPGEVCILRPCDIDRVGSKNSIATESPKISEFRCKRNAGFRLKRLLNENSR